MLDFNGKTYIAMPPEQARWYIDRKDNATSIQKAVTDKILADKAWPEIQDSRHDHTRNIVRQYLTPKLEMLAPKI